MRRVDGAWAAERNISQWEVSVELSDRGIPGAELRLAACRHEELTGGISVIENETAHQCIRS